MKTQVGMPCREVFIVERHGDAGVERACSTHEQTRLRVDHPRSCVLAHLASHNLYFYCIILLFYYLYRDKERYLAADALT